jgi:hypothetical protein
MLSIGLGLTDIAPKYTNEVWSFKMSYSHGELEISIVGNVITAVFIGSFNYEGALDYSNRMKSIITSLKEKPFVMVIDNTKLEGGTPEGFEELEIFNSWLNQTQLKAKAFIMNSEVNRAIIENRTPSLSSQNTCFFSNYQEANEWLETFG